MQFSLVLVAQVFQQRHILNQATPAKPTSVSIQEREEMHRLAKPTRLALLIVTVCIVTMGVSASDVKASMMRPLTPDDSCISITYNGHSYVDGNTLPPFPVGTSFSVQIDWSNCFVPLDDSFTTTVDIDTSSGQEQQQTYNCTTVSRFCDNARTFTFTSSQVISTLSTSVDTGDPNNYFSSHVSVDSGACTHAFVVGNSSTMFFGIGVNGVSGEVTGTVWEYKHENPNSSFTPCGTYYGQATYYSTSGLAGKGAIWLYDRNTRAYLASSPTPYINPGTSVSSNYTNTVSASNGVYTNLGIEPNSSSTYQQNLYLLGPYGP